MRVVPTRGHNRLDCFAEMWTSEREIVPIDRFASIMVLEHIAKPRPLEAGLWNSVLAHSGVQQD